MKTKKKPGNTRKQDAAKSRVKTTQLADAASQGQNQHGTLRATINRLADTLHTTAMSCYEARQGYWDSVHFPEGFDTMRMECEAALALMGEGLPDYAARDAEEEEEEEDSAARKQSHSGKADAMKQKTEVVSSHDYRKKAIASLCDSNFDAALACASDAIKLEPDNVSLYMLRSAIHFGMGDHVVKGGCGFDDWEKAVSLDPSLTSEERPSASELQFNLRPTSELPTDVEIVDWLGDQGCDDQWVDHGDECIVRAVLRKGTEYTVWQDRALTDKEKGDLIDEFVYRESLRDYKEAAANLLTVLGVEDY